MVFVGYEPGSKAWHFYNPITKHMHLPHDAVFEEDWQWKWTGDKCGVRTGDKELFAVEHVIVCSTNMMPINM
jgi:hypothetical protein